MFLSGAFLGYSYFAKAVQFPVPAAYTKIQFFGDIIVDAVHILNYTMTEEECNAVDPLILPGWTDNTIALANFTYTLQAGNILNLTESITGWDIYRKVTGETALKYIGHNGATEITFDDFYASANKNYQHVIFPITSTQIGEPIVTNSVSADFYGWFLVGEDSGGTYVYKFDMNLDFGGYQNAEDVTEYETYNKYNAFAKGSRDFLRGEIQCLAGEIENSSGEFLQPIEYMDTLRTRINDSTTKTLKSRKGEIYKVKTRGFSMTPLDNAIGSQPYMMGFSFIQCEDI